MTAKELRDLDKQAYEKGYQIYWNKKRDGKTFDIVGCGLKPHILINISNKNLKQTIINITQSRLLLSEYNRILNIK